MNKRIVRAHIEGLLGVGLVLYLAWSAYDNWKEHGTDLARQLDEQYELIEDLREQYQQLPLPADALTEEVME
jgi:cell division protein FtsB